jgi:hypothetical protein
VRTLNFVQPYLGGHLDFCDTPAAFVGAPVSRSRSPAPDSPRHNEYPAMGTAVIRDSFPNVTRWPKDTGLSPINRTLDIRASAGEAPVVRSLTYRDRGVALG